MDLFNIPNIRVSIFLFGSECRTRTSDSETGYGQIFDPGRVRIGRLLVKMMYQPAGLGFESILSTIPVVYRAGFVYYAREYFSFLAARIAAIRRIRPVHPEF